jgi:GTP-binding protein HflX
VRERIATLRKRLLKVEKTRSLQRRKREEVPYATVALVGYTNSGKSTLMNALTRAGVFVEDKLFATLDPTIRCLRLPEGDKVMVIDTVGFINKIPHSLIQAFKSTLEEVRNADLLLHLMDLTSPVCERQVRVVETVLDEIGAGTIARILVPNKIDVASGIPCAQFGNHGTDGVCPISARTGEGLDQLLQKVSAVLNRGKEKVEFFFSPLQGSLLSLLRRQGRVMKEEYQGESVHVTAFVSPKLAGQIRKWLSANDPQPSG